MCWLTARDQAVVRECGDDVQRTAKVVGGVDVVLLQIKRVEQCVQTGSVSIGHVVDMDVDVSTDDDRSTLQQ